MKICTKCGISKEKTDFFVKDKASGRMHAQCKACYKANRQTYYLAHYKKYRAHYLQRAKERRKQLRSEFHDNMRDYLSGKACLQCGESDMRVLEFDHLDPSSKKFNISQAMKLGYKWSDTLNEINKCRILCANCHKRHTSSQFGWYKAEYLSGGTDRI